MRLSLAVLRGCGEGTCCDCLSRAGRVGSLPILQGDRWDPQRIDEEAEPQAHPAQLGPSSLALATVTQCPTHIAFLLLAWGLPRKCQILAFGGSKWGRS